MKQCGISMLIYLIEGYDLKRSGLDVDGSHGLQEKLNEMILKTKVVLVKF